MSRKTKTGYFRKWAACVLMIATVLIGSISSGAAEQTETKSILPGGKECYNLLMVGSDRRDDSWNGNSDVMILATIRSDTKEIMITSFMRDLYADIPGHGVHKLNYAYAVGGGEKLEETLEENYQLKIDNYAVVDFDAMAEIIDMLGGVEINVLDEECSVLNRYLDGMNASEYSMTQGGIYRLNGRQAVAYMRIRYIGNNDYQRTQRQRDVLKAVFASVKEQNVAELTGLAQQVMQKVDHNIGILQLAQLIAAVPELTGYELTEQRIPYDGLFYSQNEMLVPDFEATITQLHESLGM